MISAKDFVDILRKEGFVSFTGVPCSFFQAAINFVIDDPALFYTIVPNEGSALALASGAALAGRPTAVLIQNSGFGNLINPLTSLNMIYRLPVLIFMSGRAYGVPDEPQHEIMGKTMGPLLDALGIPHLDMPGEIQKFEKAVQEAVRRMNREKSPFVFLVRKGTIDDYQAARKDNPAYPLKRIEAIRIISQALQGDECLVATTGKPSRELFNVCDRNRNFYMQGSMGHAASFGLGVALSRPDKKVVVLDGDGALLMHMGILSSIGHYRPKNLYHIVLDNESYESTGGQDTTSPTTDFCLIAKACGYRTAEEAATEKDLKVKLASLLQEEGPAFLRIKTNRLPTPDVPRISNRYTSEQIAETFKAALSP
ncbi:MAG: phosphonopyruvate decarboxylase [Candidatus Omnitrophica bacterium]|nr:phosphonopyruvate decarboxylase [Candidatus Omnitrophota bacterium]